MPTSLGEGLLSSPRLLAGDQGAIKMPQQTIEMQEVGSSANSDAAPSDTAPGVRSRSPKGKPRRVSGCLSCTISNDKVPCSHAPLSVVPCRVRLPSPWALRNASQISPQERRSCSSFLG